MDWLMTLPAQAGAQPSIFNSMLIPMSLMFAVIWVLMIMPARKRQKQLEALLDNLAKGDKVITNGGFYGKVAKVDGEIVVIELADNVKVRISKRAIAGLEGSPAEDGSK